MRARAAPRMLVLSDLPDQQVDDWLHGLRSRPFERGERQTVRRPLKDALPWHEDDPALVIAVATTAQVPWLFAANGALAHVPPPGPRQTLYATAVQPGDPARVIQSLVAADTSALQRALRTPARPRTDFLLLEDDLPRAYGSLDGPEMPWSIGPHTDLARTSKDSDRVHAIALGDASRDLESLVQRASIALTSTAATPMAIVYHPTLESLALATGRMELALLHDDGRIHAWSGAADLAHGSTVGLWLASHAKLANDSLQLGWQTYLGRDFYGEPWSFWAAWLATAKAAPSASELLQRDTLARWSPLFVAPLAAALIAGIARHAPADALESALSSFDGNSMRLTGNETTDLTTLDRWYRAELDTCAQQFADRIATRRTQRRPPLPRFQKGFCFAHEGYNIVDGYGSEAACAALDAITTLGGNAVSVTPFGYQADLDRPTLEAFARFSRSAGGENDAAVIKACREAQARRMFVMLKPHLWTSHGSWCGEIQMKNAADWDEFFARYERFILHYALIGEMLHLDALAIGTELKGTTGNENAARWQGVLAKARGVFAGSITYAANWSDEADRLPFAHLLDFIGVNAYWPLATGTEATDDALREGAKRVADAIEHIAKNSGKPVVLTEVGFPAVAACWQHPFSEAGPRSNDDQTRCYAALLGALGNRHWLRGIYVWKWPSTLRRVALFCPDGRPAKDEIRRFFADR